MMVVTIFRNLLIHWNRPLCSLQMGSYQDSLGTNLITISLWYLSFPSSQEINLILINPFQKEEYLTDTK